MKITINGSVPPKKNSRIHTRSGMSFPSKRYTDWEKDALMQIMAQRHPKVTSYPVSMRCVFYVVDNRKRDLSNMQQSIEDMLQKAGVITGDDWQTLRPIMSDCAGIDKLHPRCEIYFE